MCEKLGEMAEAEEDLYCLCRRPYQDSEFMIECDICKDWFHGSCVGIEEHQSTDIDKYHCPNCQPEHGPLTLKRRRNWHRHDYSEINDGGKAIQSGTVVFVKNLKKKKFHNADGEVLFRVKGSEVTVEYFDLHGFDNPLIVDKKDGLGLKMPPKDFTIADVERCVGSMRELDVIDVSRQEDLRMKMREWTDYYEDRKARNKILNVISLEFTGTELAKLVTPPLVVRKIDWINNHWPDTLPEESPLTRPLVQKYCLMSVKDSYTDFHVDFGGTSVWYHILRGQKVFYLIPPTEENLLHYEDWVMSPNQSEVFFADVVPSCYVATINEGNTLFIPSGWIHAVLTPQDSLVFGGNFLNRFSMGMQLRIYEIERRLNTPLKFRHPCYEALTWYAARNYLKESKEHLGEESAPPTYLVEGLKEVLYSFNEWTRNKESMKVHGVQIPDDIRPSRLIEQLSKVIEKALEKMKTDKSSESEKAPRKGVALPRTRPKRVSSRRGSANYDGVGFDGVVSSLTRPKRVSPRRAGSLEASSQDGCVVSTRPRRKRVSPKRDGMLEGEMLEDMVSSRPRRKLMIAPKRDGLLEGEVELEGVVSTRPRRKRVSPKSGEMLAEDGLEGAVSTHPRRKRVSPKNDEILEEKGLEGVVSIRPRRNRVPPKGDSVVSTRPKRKRVSPKRDDVYESYEEGEGEEEEEEWLAAPQKRVSPRRRGTSEEGEEGIKAAADRRRRSITMKLATSESKVIRRSGDPRDNIALKLSVPEAKVVSTSLGEEWEEEREGEEGEEEEEEEAKKRRERSFTSTSSSEGINDNASGGQQAGTKPRGGAGQRNKYRVDQEWKKDFRDGDYLYPTLEEPPDEESGSGSKGVGSGRKLSEHEEDTLWRPQGVVQLMKGSIASSYRESRNAKKRSFEQSMSATAAKILKMEQEKGEGTIEESSSGSKVTPSLPAADPPRTRQMDPILGGGALKVEGCGGSNGRVSGDTGGEDKVQQSRAAAAATAVSAMLAASRPRMKLLTPKQRLGKIMGLSKQNKRKL